MESNKMKNMVILRNLPSNMVEEAFVVFKNNVKIHKTKMADINKSISKSENQKFNDYIIKEAELVVSNYISQIEKKELELSKGNIKLKEKYKRLKVMSIFLAFFSFFCVISIIFK